MNYVKDEGIYTFGKEKIEEGYYKGVRKEKVYEILLMDS